MSQSDVRRVMGQFASFESRQEQGMDIFINEDRYSTESPLIPILRALRLVPFKNRAGAEYPIEIQYDRSDRVTSVRVQGSTSN